MDNRTVEMDAPLLDAFGRVMEALMYGKPINKDDIRMALPVAWEISKPIGHRGFKIIKEKDMR